MVRYQMSAGCVFFYLAFVILMGIGWVKNVIHLVSIEQITFTGEEICRLVGVFLAPLGSLMGWVF